MQRRHLKIGYLASSEAKAISRRAENIAGDYVRGSRGFAKSRSSMFKDLKTTRIQVPPYLRPSSVLKREIYRFSVDIYREGEAKYLEEIYHYRRRQAANLADRLRNPTVVDLAIRVVRWSEQPMKMGNKHPPIFTNSLQKQIVTELNYAFANRIDPDLCTAFIMELGGHEIIGAMVSTQKSELQDGWLRAMQRGSRFTVGRKPTALYGTRQLRVMHTSEDDAVREAEAEAAEWEEEEAEREDDEW